MDSLINRTNPRSSPCIGICSTTYGDLVCRGCNRFSHEITGWNGYTEAQRKAVWDRLGRIRRGAIGRWIVVVDPCALIAHARRSGIAVETASADGPGYAARADLLKLAHDVLRRVRLPVEGFRAMGLEIAATMPGGSMISDSAELLRCVDRECYARSLAVYERSFRIAAQ